MARKYYDNIQADYINLKIKCNCGEIIEGLKIPVTSCIDTNRDVNTFSYNLPPCEKCGEIHQLYFYDDMITSYCEIPTLKKDEDILMLHEIPVEYAENMDCSLVDYCQEITKIESLIESISLIQPIDEGFIIKMAYSYAISIMDAYLANTFQYHISISKESRDKFMIYRGKNKTVDCKSELERLDYKSFQNLNLVVIPYFKNAFDINIPENDIIQNAVKKRNTITHNYGREKDGYQNIITKDDVLLLLGEIRALVSFVHMELTNMYVEKMDLKR